MVLLTITLALILAVSPTLIETLFPSLLTLSPVNSAVTFVVLSVIYRYPYATAPPSVYAPTLITVPDFANLAGIVILAAFLRFPFLSLESTAIASEFLEPSKVIFVILPSGPCANTFQSVTLYVAFLGVTFLIVNVALIDLSFLGLIT